LALYFGIATLDHSSGQPKRSYQVNTQGKAAMTIAMARHAEQVAVSRTYFERKRMRGQTHNRAVRSLGRQVGRVV